MNIMDIAIAKSYTEASLTGAGALKGQDGKDGADGKSAYEIACDNGFEGTEQEWLDSLKAEAIEDSGDKNIIESVSVNGTTLIPDENKNIDITIPDEYDDTTLSEKVTNLETSVENVYTKNETYSREEVNNTLLSIISDSEVRIDKTYSSSKIYLDIQQALTDSKAYTLAEIGKANGASYKVATSTDEMTDTKYIYLLLNGDTYDLYIFEEDTATVTKIGNTTIDLSDYYTKSEVDDTFVLQITFDALNGNIGDVSTLNTDAKVLVESINEINTAVDNILGGAVAISNADKLDGYDSEYFAAADDLANYLPKTGGTVTGKLTVNASQFGVVSPNAEVTRSYFGNPSRSLMHIVGADGAYGFYDNTNSKFIMQSSTDCTNTFNGTASGNLPLDGGKISKASYEPLAIENTQTGASGVYVRFLIDGNIKGQIGVSDEGNPIFYSNSESKSYKLLHAGNYSDYAMSKPITLWENPDLTAEFPSQTITLNAEFANCKYYEIICIRRSSSETGRLVSFSSGRIPISQAVLLNLFTQYYYTRLSNIPSISNCTITFNDCTASSTYGVAENDITDNTFCVPMRIIGYKE